MTTVSDIIRELEAIAPPELADAQDRIGLQAGDPAAQVETICVTVDVTDRVIEKAAECGCDIIVAHHPLIYNPLLSVAPTNPVQRRLMTLVKSDIALYIMHTNFDAAADGINDALALRLGVVDCRPLTTQKTDGFIKVVVFVPESALEGVRNAMSEAGAGVIGRYSQCSFRSIGTGSFVPAADANPYIGSADKLEEVQEYRLEMTCASSMRKAAVEAMLRAHPYEEAAYDIYELANDPVVYGYGRVGALAEPTSLRDFVNKVKTALGLEYARVSGNLDKPVGRVALCGGSGSSQYREAVRAGADVYVTGDTKHHDILDADDLGLAIIDAGHFHTEKPGMVALADRLGKLFGSRGIAVEYVE